MNKKDVGERHILYINTHLYFTLKYSKYIYYCVSAYPSNIHTFNITAQAKNSSSFKSWVTLDP